MWMELKFLLCCQQTYRDLDADSRGKQSPHQERVKEHELWHGMLSAKQMGHAVGGWAEGRWGWSLLPLLSAHSCHPAKSKNSCC